MNEVAAAAPSSRIEPHVWRIASVVVLGSIMSILDTTIVNVALETLGRDLHATLADIHGNLPALRAVLSDLDNERVDALVVAGDVVGGPYPREVLDVLAARRESVVWIRGNCEREAVAACDGAARLDAWRAALHPGHRAGW